MSDTQLLPTPEVGYPVNYYPDDMDTNNFVAAICTRVEGPGKIGIVVFTHNFEHRYLSGVQWIGDDRRLSPDRPFRRFGCWEFLPSLRPRSSLGYHQAELAKHAAAAEAQATAVQQAHEARVKAHEARKKAVAT